MCFNLNKSKKKKRKKRYVRALWSYSAQEVSWMDIFWLWLVIKVHKSNNSLYGLILMTPDIYVQAIFIGLLSFDFLSMSSKAMDSFAPARCGSNFENISFKLIIKMVAYALAEESFSGECNRTSLLRSIGNIE